jgi:hypothetical protein
MIAAEPHGPLTNALRKGLEIPEPVPGGPSVAFSIASPYGTYQGRAAGSFDDVLRTIRESYGLDLGD